MVKLLKPRTAWHLLNNLKSKAELNLHDTLMCGQVFRWKKLSTTSFVGVIQDCIVELKETIDDQNKFSIYFRQYNEEQEAAENVYNLEQIIRSYFQLDYVFEESIPNLETLYMYFSKKDPIVFSKICNHFQGMRVIKQDLLECLISFICSSNNNVNRITLMLDRFCKMYGTNLGTIVLEENSNKETLEIYSFPTIAQLSNVTKEALEGLGFGYRAGFIVETIQLLIKQPDLLSKIEKEAESISTEQCLERLVQFKGVGYKVAACIALYSLQKFDCVPLDVHILNLVNNHYSRFIKEQSSSLTKSAIKNYMDFFKSHFGNYCGFAQMVLYGSQVASFKQRLPNELQDLLSSPKVKSRKNSNLNPSPKSKKEYSSSSPSKAKFEDDWSEDDKIEDVNSATLVRKEFNLRQRTKVNYNIE